MNTNFTPSDSWTLFIFILILLSVIFMILFGAYKIDKKVALQVGLFLTIWVSALSLLVSSGLLTKYTIPMLPIFFFCICFGGVGFGLSSWGTKMSQLPLWMLVVFHSFRWPLEWVLHEWALQGTVPETMTWTGQNFDILTGVMALGILIPFVSQKNYAWLFNIVGSLLLFNVLRVVVFSSGLPFSWPLEKPLLLALYLPYALIAIVCVWSAIAGHVILWRALLTKHTSVVPL